MEASSIVFIGNLAWTTNEAVLHGFASAGGTVVEVELKQHADTGRSKGWGLVTYASPEAAVGAIRKLDGQELDGRLLHLRLDRSLIENVGITVFVGNLPWSTTSEELREIFQAYFKPIDVHVKTNMAGRSRGFAQVTFRTEEEAEKAIYQFNGMELGERKVEVRLDHMHSSPSTGVGYVLVSNIPWSATEQQLHEFCAIGGPVVEVKVLRQKDGKSKGIAIVTYASEAEATNAVDILSSTSFGDRPLKAKIYIMRGPTANGKARP